jgi:hypothetical protein
MGVMSARNRLQLRLVRWLSIIYYNILLRSRKVVLAECLLIHCTEKSERQRGDVIVKHIAHMFHAPSSTATFFTYTMSGQVDNRGPA